MPSLFGCLLIGIAFGLISHLIRWRPSGDTLLFICVMSCCGAVLGGLVVSPLLGFTSRDVNELTGGAAAGALAGSIVLVTATRFLRMFAGSWRGRRSS